MKEQQNQIASQQALIDKLVEALKEILKFSNEENTLINIAERALAVVKEKTGAGILVSL